MADTDTAPAARDRIAIALDVDDLVAAMRLAKAVQPHFAVAKVGLELYSAVGPDAVGRPHRPGLGRVRRPQAARHPDHRRPRRPRARRPAACPVAQRPRRWAATDMLRAGVEGLQEGADDAGLAQPIALAVTVLTSEHDAPPSLLAERAGLAAAAGCGGVVCAAPDLGDHPLRRALAAVRHARHPPGGQRRRRPGAGLDARPRPSHAGQRPARDRPAHHRTPTTPWPRPQPSRTRSPTPSPARRLSRPADPARRSGTDAAPRPRVRPHGAPSPTVARAAAGRPREGRRRPPGSVPSSRSG